MVDYWKTWTRDSHSSTKMGADKLAETTQMPQNLSAQIGRPSPKVWDFDEKRLHWASVVRAGEDY